jgi:uncharacterized protein (TIGR02145 family)
VVITSTVFGPRDGYTDSNGVVSGLVPANEELVVNVYIICGSSEILVYTETIGPLTEDAVSIWSIANLPDMALLQGQLLNTEGNSVDGYVYLENGSYVTTINGSYELLTCVGNTAVNGLYYQDNEVCMSNPQSVTLNLGVNTLDISVLECTAFGQPGVGGIDQDGDVFNSVIIGDQDWMSQNLDVAVYTDGTPIPQVTDLNVWISLTTGAWCWYNNDSAMYAATYGRLYNWYAREGIYDAASEANPALRKQLAPAGWHLPSDAEINELRSYLESSTVTSYAGGMLKSAGTLEAGTGLWHFPNIDASNLTGFSGHPGGTRSMYGNFVNLGYEGSWAGSSLSQVNGSTYSSGFMFDYYNSGWITVGFPFTAGANVRCVRD